MTMIAYAGQTGSEEWARELSAARLGECCVRGMLPPRRTPWFYDNGAFADFCDGLPFDAVRFERDMRAIRLWSDPAGPGIPFGKHGAGTVLPLPDFVVLPDKVADGERSLAFTESFLAGPDAPVGGYPDAPLYLAVQDGMGVAEVAQFLIVHRLAGIFVGGSLPWKVATGEQWVRLAHRLGRRCHIGRAMSADRFRWAERVGADSVDGNAPLWSREGLERFRRVRDDRVQMALAL